VRVERWWNDNDWGKPNYSEKILFQCLLTPPQISRTIAWDYSCASAFKSWTNRWSRSTLVN